MVRKDKPPRKRNQSLRILSLRAPPSSATSVAVKSATTALEGVRQEQEVGTRTILDVLDAEQELYQKSSPAECAEK